MFLKLLGDGVLYTADGSLNKKEDLYYPLIEVIRRENEKDIHYAKDDKGKLLLSLPAIEFETKARILLDEIKRSNHTTFEIHTIERFMQVIKCTKVKADSKDKSDITLVLHDCMTYSNETFGFSIKSRLGGSSTLLNSGKSTNFIYEIAGQLSKEQIDEINAINSRAKLRDRLKRILGQGATLRFYGLEKGIFHANLQMVDTMFPLIASEFLLQYYLGNGNLVSELAKKVRETNPCNFNTDSSYMHYEYKIKNFLTDIALGMTPATIFDGLYQATGGYIIVQEDGEILCYHVYNHNEFQEYLFNNTRLDTPSTTKYDFGYIYKEDGKLYIKLNLQIRFL